MNPQRFARVVAILGVVFWVVVGAWAFFAPKSFAENVATFEPYNEHFLHDAGSFALGLGAALIIALMGMPGLTTALGGGAVAALFHVIAHIMDSDQGGNDTDPIGLGIFALLSIGAAAAAWPRRRV